MARGLGLTGIMAGLLAGCGMLFAPQQPQQAPIPPGPLAPILRAPSGALVECRGVPHEQCFSFIDGQDPGVVRTIVTCTSSCTAIEGDVRIDVLHPDGTVASAGAGSYASAVDP